MNKNRICRSKVSPLSTEGIRTLKVIILFFFIGQMQVFADENDDVMKLTLDMRNINKVEEKSEFHDTIRADINLWNLVLFTDWYSVWPGNVRVDTQGDGYANEVPQGVRLEVQEAETSGPVLQADQPWESYLSGYVSVVRTSTGFKMWYPCTAIVRDKKSGKTEEDVEFDPMAGETKSVKKLRFICYAESEDGYTWSKPELGLHKFAGSTANNIVIAEGSNHFDNVFIDKGGNYRMLFHGRPIKNGKSIWKAMRSFTSSDGILWTTEDKPVLDMYCDSQNVGFYDALFGKYVIYLRYARGNRRAIGMTEGQKFQNLPHPWIVLEPDAQDPPSLDFYTPGYSRHPDYMKANYQTEITDPMGRLPTVTNHDGHNMHYMFSSMYHRERDVLDVQLAVSRDGLQWTRPDRKAIIPLGLKDGSESMSLYAAPGIHVLKPSFWGVLYAENNTFHNMAFVNSNIIAATTFHWATWRENRLVALRADAEGTCTITFRGHAAKEIRMNYRTDKGGWIRAELVSGGLWPPTGPLPIEGYTFSDCEPLKGDSLSQVIKWNDRAMLPSHNTDGNKTILRLHMFRARIFAIEWK